MQRKNAYQTHRVAATLRQTPRNNTLRKLLGKVTVSIRSSLCFVFYFPIDNFPQKHMHNNKIKSSNYLVKWLADQSVPFKVKPNQSSTKNKRIKIKQK